MQLSGGKQLTALAREHGVDHTTIYRWRDQMQTGALDALRGKRQPPIRQLWPFARCDRPESCRRHAWASSGLRAH
jgi:transposase-like protein